MHENKIKIVYLWALLAVPLLLSTHRPPAGKKTALNRRVLEQRLHQLARKAEGYLPKVAVDSLKIPRALDPNGSLHGTGSREWTSGFYSGTLWQLYRFSKRERLREYAETWMAFQEKEKQDPRTHDLGFKIYCSFGEAYRTEPLDRYRQIILEASRTLIRRFNPTVGAIRSWDHSRDKWGYPVIIDNMMNLDMLFTATRFSGDSAFYHVARKHAETTLKNHFREDGSSCHVVDYDTLSGEVLHRQTHQGAAHGSAWSRGQAWGLYGFAMVWRETKDPRFLEQAKTIARFFFQHPRLPADKIPYWDFDAPGIPAEPRDASAAAIAACGLLLLYEADPQSQYLEWADDILNSLAQSEYAAHTAPFLLQHSVGNLPSRSEIDVPIVYADYYYVEALLRRLQIAKNPM